MILNSDITIDGCGRPRTGSSARATLGRLHRPLQPGHPRPIFFPLLRHCDHISLINGHQPALFGDPCDGSARLVQEHLRRDHRLEAEALGADLLFDGDTFRASSRCTSSDPRVPTGEPGPTTAAIRDSVFPHCEHGSSINSPTTWPTSRSATTTPPRRRPDLQRLPRQGDQQHRPANYYALDVHKCTNCTIRSNELAPGPRMPSGEISLNNNSSATSARSTPGTAARTGRYAYNIWKGAKYGKTDQECQTPGSHRGRSRFSISAWNAWLATIDQGSSTGYLRRDINGQRRRKG